MVDYNNIERRIAEIGVTKAFVSRKMGKSRSWLNSSRANSYDRSRRSIPITAEMHVIINKQRAMNGAREHVFAGKTGKPVENSALRRCANVTAQRLGFKAGMHALRHTFATNAIRAGVDMRTLAELLGHSDVAFTMQVYGHSDEAMKIAAMERINSQIHKHV